MISALVAMSALLIGVAQAEDEDSPYPETRIPFERGLSPRKATFDGTFHAAPSPHWSRRLPGPPLNSATHSERTRPVITGEGILIGSAAGQALYLLSRRDGGLIREFPAAASVESESLVHDGKVYFTDTGGHTWCYTLSGQRVWSHDSKAPTLVRPTILDGRIYITNVDDLAVALDAQTGALVWRYQAKKDLTREAELALYAAPPAVLVDDLVILGFSDGSIVGLDAESGVERWRRRVGEGRYPDVVAEPVAHGTDLFASGYYRPLVAIDKATRNVRWRLEHGAAAGVVVDDRQGAAIVYHPGADGKLRAVVALTGAEKWVWDSGTKGAISRPVITEAGLVVASSEGAVYIVNPEDGSTEWKHHEPFMLRGVTSSPAVQGRQMVFVTNAGQVVSMLVPQERRSWAGERFDLRKQASRPRPSGR